MTQIAPVEPGVGEDFSTLTLDEAKARIETLLPDGDAKYQKGLDDCVAGRKNTEEYELYVRVSRLTDFMYRAIDFPRPPADEPRFVEQPDNQPSLL